MLVKRWIYLSFDDSPRVPKKEMMVTTMPVAIKIAAEATYKFEPGWREILYQVIRMLIFTHPRVAPWNSCLKVSRYLLEWNDSSDLSLASLGLACQLCLPIEKTTSPPSCGKKRKQLSVTGQFVASLSSLTKMMTLAKKRAYFTPFANPSTIFLL